jgi:hypothetical protein
VAATVIALLVCGDVVVRGPDRTSRPAEFSADAI